MNSEPFLNSNDKSNKDYHQIKQYLYGSSGDKSTNNKSVNSLNKNKYHKDQQ